MAEVDHVERLLDFKRRNPGAVFDLAPNRFSATLPGCDEPFTAITLRELMDKLARHCAEETLGRLLSGERRGPTGMPPS